MFRIITSEHKEILYSELFGLAPPDLEASFIRLSILSFKTCRIKHIVHFLVVDLEEWGVNVDSSGPFGGLCLLENLVDCSDS